MIFRRAVALEFNRKRVQPRYFDSGEKYCRIFGGLGNWPGGVDKFEPVFGGGDMDHGEEALGELFISRRDSSVDFQTAEEAFDVVSFTIERPVMFDFDPAVRTTWDDGLDVAAREVGANGIGVVSLVGEGTVKANAPPFSCVVTIVLMPKDL